MGYLVSLSFFLRKEGLGALLVPFEMYSEVFFTERFWSAFETSQESERLVVMCQYSCRRLLYKQGLELVLKLSLIHI